MANKTTSSENINDKEDIEKQIIRLHLSKNQLRIGIFSDAQFAEEDELLSPGHFGCVMKGPKHFQQALRFNKKRGMDLLIMNGDMVNGGYKTAYHTFNNLLNDVYGKQRKELPPIIYPMGNHEYYCPDAENRFMEMTGLKPDTHYIINGIHIIGISCSDASGGYSQRRLTFLKEHLKVAVKESGRKPIIVISHMPFHVDEFYGGEYCSPQADAMYTILEDYPQVIYFCGHSHYPIYSEKSLLQKDFTMINTGGIAYFDLVWNKSSNSNLLDEEQVNEYLNPHLIGIYDQQDIYQRDEFNQGWEMNIDSETGQVRLQRIDYTLARPFGKQIVLENLYNKNFTRTLKQLKDKAKVPTFPLSATVAVSQNVDGVADLCFDAALPDEVVQSYELNFTYPDKSRKKIRIMAQSFYLGWDFPYKEHLRFYDCHQKGCYKLSIKAISSMGKESKYIKTKFMIK